jgi:hypothetical protein
VLFPKGLERCDGYDSHCPIMVPAWDQCKTVKEKYWALWNVSLNHLKLCLI